MQVFEQLFGESSGLFLFYVIALHSPKVGNVEKPIDFWLRKGKAGGEPKPTENRPTNGSGFYATFSTFFSFSL